MAKGEVVECGTHKELVAAGTIFPRFIKILWNIIFQICSLPLNISIYGLLTGGVYADMWGEQARGEEVHPELRGGGGRERGRGRGGGGGGGDWN